MADIIRDQHIANRNSSEEVSLRDLIIKTRRLIGFLISHWKIIFAMQFLGLIGGVIYATKKPTTYTAATTFVLDDAGSSKGLLSQYSGLASMMGVNLGGNESVFQEDNIIELYRSRNMIQRTLLMPIKTHDKTHLLVDDYLKSIKFREGQKNQNLKNIDFNLRGGSFSRSQDSLLDKIVKEVRLNNLTVSKPDKKLSIIEVRTTSTDEIFAKEFDNQIVKTVNDFYVQTKTKKALENLKILQHQTDSVRNVLNGVIYRSAEVNDATPNLNPTKQILRVPIQKFQINAEANKAILNQLVQNLEMAKLSLRVETPLIQVIDEPILPLEKNKLGKLVAGIIGAVLMGFFTILFLVFKIFFSKQPA